MTGSRIPFCGVKRQYANLREEILEETGRVLATGQYISGPETAQFEEEIRLRCNRKYAIAVNSATTGLTLSLLALSNSNKIGTPNFSFAANASSIAMAHKDPVPFDVDFDGMINLDTLDLAEQKVDALVYVNMFGNILDYNKLLLLTGFFQGDEPIPIIEDAAQSFGAFYRGQPSGSLGHISVLSFDPTKNLPNYGSGGMILTDDENIARTVRALANNSIGLHHNPIPGPAMNGRMSEVDCACMRVKLKYFDEWQTRRTQIARYYSENLKEITTPVERPEVTHAWHKYVVHTHIRDLYSSGLSEAGIESKIHYRQPLYPTYLENLSISALLGQISLSLPIYPELSDSEVEYIVDVMNKITDGIYRHNMN